MKREDYRESGLAKANNSERKRSNIFWLCLYGGMLFIICVSFGSFVFCLHSGTTEERRLQPVSNNTLALEQHWGFVLVGITEALKANAVNVAKERSEMALDSLIVNQWHAMEGASQKQKKRIRTFLSFVKTFRRSYPREPLQSKYQKTKQKERDELASEAKDILSKIPE